VYGTSQYHYLTVYNVSQNSTSFANTQQIIAQTLLEDAAFIGRYAIAMQVRFMGHNYFCLNISLFPFFGEAIICPPACASVLLFGICCAKLSMFAHCSWKWWPGMIKSMKKTLRSFLA